MFTSVQIGTPITHGSLTVFPLFCPETHPVNYDLSDDAMESGTIQVDEVSQQGSVPDLTVENKGEKLVLFLEGEQLIGAKQNRILNTSLLVPAKAKITVPVSCVEQGRWRRASVFFKSSKKSTPHSIRHALKKSVTTSLKEKRGHRSDQGQVWEEVRKQQESLGVSSETSALEDTYEKYEKNLEDAQKTLAYAPGACGLAVAMGSQIVTADLFDKPLTCEKVWDKLLSGLVLDTLVENQNEGPPDSAQVEKLVEEVRNASWMKMDTVGEGQEYRTEFDGKVGSALLLDGNLVHGSVVGGV